MTGGATYRGVIYHGQVTRRKSTRWERRRRSRRRDWNTRLKCCWFVLRDRSVSYKMPESRSADLPKGGIQVGLLNDHNPCLRTRA